MSDTPKNVELAGNSIITTLIAGVIGAAGGIGVQQINLPDLERRVDKCESTNLTMEYRVTALESQIERYRFPRRSSILTKQE